MLEKINKLSANYQIIKGGEEAQRLFRLYLSLKKGYNITTKGE